MIPPCKSRDRGRKPQSGASDGSPSSGSHGERAYMIINVFSITELFIALLSVTLMAWAATFASILAWRWGRRSAASERTRIEEQSHLVLLVAVVLLAVRLLNWPFFYATLQSFVPEIDGAMCIFGVTEIKRIATRVGELVKPLSFFLMGGFLLLHMLDHRAPTSPLMGRKLIMLAGTAVVVAFDSLLDGFLMLSIVPGQLVSCCTTVTDILGRPSRMVPKATFGQNYQAILEYGYYVSNIFLLAILGGCWAAIKKGILFRRRAALGLICACAAVNATIFLVAQIEVHAPRIMGLPFHHCLYCLWQNVPDTIVMYALFTLGTFATGWALLLDLVARTSREPGGSPRISQRIDRILDTLFGRVAINEHSSSVYHVKEWKRGRQKTAPHSCDLSCSGDSVGSDRGIPR